MVWVLGIVSGRKIAEEHLDVCLLAGLNITGINAEVMLGQWEYQLFGKGAKEYQMIYGYLDFY